MGELLLVHHAARRGHNHPPSSLSAIRECLEAGARVVEIDITPLADGDFALLHDGMLQHATDGHGAAFAATSGQVRRLHYASSGGPTAEPVGLLSQAVTLIRDFTHLEELQLDLKPHAALTDTVLKSLLTRVEPVKHTVRVTTGADWALRPLRELDGELALGFDPLFYLGVVDEESQDPSLPPFRTGAYGYADDHPLGTRVWGSPAAYLTARAEALCAQAPAGGVWYLDARLIGCAIDDGFDWIGYLHRRGCEIDAWTLDASDPLQLDSARRLTLAGVDRITTNDAPALAVALSTAPDTDAEPGHRRISY